MSPVLGDIQRKEIEYLDFVVFKNNEIEIFGGVYHLQEMIKR